MQAGSAWQARQNASSQLARRHARYLFSVPLAVRYLMPGGFRITRGMSVDISEGGISAIVEADLQIGETVGIDIPLKSGQLNTVAILRYHTSSRAGFEFLGLTMDERRQIAVAGRVS